jgi:hypothetical protein
MAGNRRVHIVSHRQPVSAPVARTGKRRLQLFFDHHLNKATHLRTQLHLDRIEPIAEKFFIGHKGRRVRGISFHGVISFGALNADSLC